MQLTTRTRLISFITTIKLLSWIRRELSCKSGILPDKSDSGLSHLIVIYALFLFPHYGGNL
ncbi:unnamed protein product [Brassica oleracea var. botrytis]